MWLLSIPFPSFVVIIIAQQGVYLGYNGICDNRDALESVIE